MTSHQMWTLAHIGLLVYWLGGDLGQFYLSFHVRRPTHSPETRLFIAKAMVALDQFPRVCLVLMLPVGLTLAELWGGPVRGAGLIAVWAAAVLWLAVVLTLHFREHAAFAEVLRKGDWALRAVLAPVLIGLGIASLSSGDPFPTDWMAWKVIIFGTIVALGLGIRIAIRPFGPALGRLVAQGSTPEVEADIARSLRPAYPMVLAIWALLIAAAALGVAKP